MHGLGRIGVGLAALLTGLALLVACGSSRIVTAPTSPRTTASPTQSSTPSAAASATPAKLGDTLELSGSQSGLRMAVTVVKVVDPAHSANDFSSPSPGNRLVAVQFRLANTGTADYSDSPSNGAQLIDAQGQGFDATIADTDAGPSFPAGVHIAPGDTALGFISFEVPNGSQVVKAQFTLESGFANETGQWLIGGSAVPGSGPAPSSSTVSSAPSPPAASASASASGDPRQVVQDYYAAINAHDYARAWDLGGKNLNSSFQSFVSGLTGTAQDTVTITGVQGSTVSVDLDATQTDGSHRHFSGTYTVQHGEITAAAIR